MTFKAYSGTKYFLGSNETYSVAGYNVHLGRWLQPYVFNVFLPTVILVLISFVSFSIPVEQVPGRMSLVITIFLMLVNISSSLQANGPKVPWMQS